MTHHSRGLFREHEQLLSTALRHSPFQNGLLLIAGMIQVRVRLSPPPLAAKPVYSPLPFPLVWHRENNRRRLLRQIELSLPDRLPLADKAWDAPEAPRRCVQAVIPSFAFKEPPKAMRMEQGMVPATPTHRLDRVMPSRRLEDVGGYPQAVRITNHRSIGQLVVREVSQALKERQGSRSVLSERSGLKG